MASSDHDNDATLVYRSTGNARQLPIGLFAIALGLVLIALTELTPSRFPALIPAGLCLLLGGAATVLALRERFFTRTPLYTLSRDGLLYRIPKVKDVFIPWRDVRRIETQTMIVDYWWPIWLFVDYATRSRKFMVHSDVTMLAVSKAFYDKHLHVESLFWRGPSWKAHFIDAGDDVLVALHHTLVSSDADALRHAVEARWQAARDRDPAPNAPAPPASAARTIVVTPSGPFRIDTPRENFKIAALLIGIVIVASNLIGLWQFPGQAADRLQAAAERAAARDARLQRDEAAKRRAEELKQRDAEQRALQRDTEETLRRAFGR